MRLAVALVFGTVGYTLIYAGMKGGPGQAWAHAPWLLWVDAFKELGSETQAAQSSVPGIRALLNPTPTPPPPPAFGYLAPGTNIGAYMGP